MRCSTWPMRCCAARGRCGCWPGCRWCRGTGGGTARGMSRATRAGAMCGGCGWLREVTRRLEQAGHWRPGEPDIIVALDAGYDVVRLAWPLADLPLVLCARLRSDRVFYRVPAPKPPGMGGPARQHGDPVRFADPV